MTKLSKDTSKKWYTIEELAELSGLSLETLRKGNSPLTKLSIDFKVDTQLGGYHNTQKFYSENVLKALKEYQIKNGVVNAVKNKETAISGNLSFVEHETVGKAIDYLLANPQTVQLLLQKSLQKNEILTLENKHLKELIEEQQPKIDFYDRAMSADGTYSMAETAKVLKLGYGNVTLFKKLKALGILDKNNVALQEYVNRGYFTVITKPLLIGDSTLNKTVTRVTSKGMEYIAKRLAVSVA